MTSLIESVRSSTRDILADDDQRFVLWGVGWKTYDTLCRQLADHPIRLTFDGTNLEIMSPSLWHEVVSSLLGRFVERAAEHRDIPYASGGSTTFRRHDLLRGLEPDRCYWITNESRIRGKRKIDLRIDPPPDLAIEVDITHSSLDRLQIYSRLGVPEVWRCDGTRLEILLLQPTGEYVGSEHSAAFSFLPAQQLVEFLPVDETQGESDCLRRFLEWIRSLRSVD